MDNGGDNSWLHGIAFAELVAFLEEMKGDEDYALIFKLAEVAQLYKNRLEQLGLKHIHTTRLKQTASALPDFKAHSQGKQTLLSFERDIGSALITATSNDSDPLHLIRAVQVVRKE